MIRCIACLTFNIKEKYFCEFYKAWYMQNLTMARWPIRISSVSCHNPVYIPLAWQISLLYNKRVLHWWVLWGGSLWTLDQVKTDPILARMVQRMARHHGRLLTPEYTCFSKIWQCEALIPWKNPFSIWMMQYYFLICMTHRILLRY